MKRVSIVALLVCACGGVVFAQTALVLKKGKASATKLLSPRKPTDAHAYRIPFDRDRQIKIKLEADSITLGLANECSGYFNLFDPAGTRVFLGDDPVGFDEWTGKVTWSGVYTLKVSMSCVEAVSEADIEKRRPQFRYVLTVETAGELSLRCGWFDNPTPGNYSLYDQQGEWILGVQGGYQLEHFVFPKFAPNQWVDYPGRSYGYGCACFEMKIDTETSRVLRVGKSYSRPLAVCRADRALKKKWGFEK